MRRERVKVSKSHTLTRKRKTRAKAWGAKGRHHNEGGRFEGKKGGQAGRASPGDVKESLSMCVDAKAFQDFLQSLGFTPGLAKPGWERRLGDKEPAHKMKE